MKPNEKKQDLRPPLPHALACETLMPRSPVSVGSVTLVQALYESPIRASGPCRPSGGGAMLIIRQLSICALGNHSRICTCWECSRCGASDQTKTGETSCQRVRRLFIQTR